MDELINKALKQGLILLLFPTVFIMIMVTWGYLDPPRGLGDAAESQRVSGDGSTRQIGLESGIR